MKKIYKTIENKLVKNNENGFTLIELIAIILILAIIALIAIPAINKIVDEVKKQAFKVTAINIVDAADKNCNVMLQQGENVNKTYTIVNHQITNGESLPISGKLPLQGNVNVSDSCLVAIAVNNNKWCALKEFSDDKVTLSEYVDGNCNYSGGPGNGDNLLVDKITEIRGSELKSGVNLGAEEYDNAILKKGEEIGYYSGKYFAGFNPNNYIMVDGKQFRIIGLTNQGIAVIGDINSSILNENSYPITLNPDFEARYNNLGLVKRGRFFTSLDDRNENTFGIYDYEKDMYIGGTVSYGGIQTSKFALLSFYDYELTIDRNAYSTCLKNNAVGTNEYGTALDFVACAPTSWLGDLGNDLYLNMALFNYGSGVFSPSYLANGKFNFLYSESSNEEPKKCNVCVEKIKLLIRNDSLYVSGDGTKENPFVYKTGFDINNFDTSECYILDELGYTIKGYDFADPLCSSNLVIPAEINGKPITNIGYGVFSGSVVTSVDFTKATNLKIIEAYAFSNSLISGAIVLPENLEIIEYNAFSKNNIAGELFIPKNLNQIEYNAFYMNSIERLIFDDYSNLKIINDNAFSDNFSLTGAINLPPNITGIGNYAFSNTNITSVSIPSTVKGLDLYSLYGTGSLTTINAYFANNGLANSPWGNTTAKINWLG